MPDIKRIAMLSVHGYFDPTPILGATDTGGQVTYVLELSKHLAMLGLGVDIFTRRFAGRPEIDPVCAGVRVVRIPCGGDEFIRKEDLFPHLDDMTTNLARFIQREALDYQLLHSHYWDAGYVAMRLTERRGGVFVHTAHSLGAWKKEQMGGDPEEMERLFNFTERIRWENEIFRRAAGQTVTTRDGKDTYKRLYDFESPDLVVIPPGVDTRRFRPLSPDERDRMIDAPEKFVFALSRIDSNKGLDYLIRAFAVVAQQNDAHLVIGGGSKNPKPHEVTVKAGLTELVRSLHLEDRVTFTGYIPDELLDTYYRRAQVFVLPSKYEPFGMTVLEAMACGTAVVATRLGGIRDVLSDAKDSLLVDPSQPQELGSAILKLLEDHAFAESIRHDGLALIRARFSWESIAEQTLSFYKLGLRL